jgi:hypothetical protein
VISESLGYDLFDNPADGQVFATDLDGKSTVGAKAANMATKKGMLFVATAGNDGWPPIPGWGNHILTPGDADSALTVGAVWSTGAVALLSGYGPNASGRVKPEVCGMGMSASTFYFAGGYTSNEIDGLNFVTITAINPSAVLVNPRIDTAGIQSTLKGYFCGGAQGNGDAVSEIDGINFSNDAGINPGAVLSENLWGSAGLKGPERRFKPR